MTQINTQQLNATDIHSKNWKHFCRNSSTRFFGPRFNYIGTIYCVGVGGHWRVGMDEPKNKNLPYFVWGNLATLWISHGMHRSTTRPNASCVMRIASPSSIGLCFLSHSPSDGDSTRLLQQVGEASSIVFLLLFACTSRGSWCLQNCT